MRTTRLKIAAVAAASTLLLAACGDDGGNGDGAGGTNGDGGEAAEPLQLGYILPESGALAFLGPPQINAVQFAVERINEAGGVLGSELPEVVAGDEAGQGEIANQAADTMIAENVQGVVGAAASGMSLAIIDKLTGEEIVQCSASNTAPTFTDYDDNGGYYIRTAPSDALQGPVLADAIIEDGHQSVAITSQADDYGRGLANSLQEALEAEGVEVVATDEHDIEAATFTGTVQNLTGSGADAFVVIAFEQGTQIIQGLVESGYGPLDDYGLYSADGMASDEVPEGVDSTNPGVLEGMRGTVPASGGNEEWIADFQEFSDLTDLTYAAQAFDCTNIIALAAESAGSTMAPDFVDELVNVVQGDTECTTFEECRDALENGDTIAYRGPSGSTDLNEGGEPSTAMITIYSFDAEGNYVEDDTREAAPEE